MQHLLNTLRRIAPDRVLENAPMSRYTTFRVGGPADALFLPASVEELRSALAAAEREGLPVCLIGNGSNLIVRDGGIRGLVIALGEPFSELRVEGAQVWAQAGARLSAVAAAAQRAGLAGLEFASGIPGTLGGGCAMNAGAYGGELKDVLLWADVLLDGEVHRLSRDEMEMGYRSTMPLRRGAIVVSACFELRSDDPEAIQARMRDLANRRREKQPLNLPSAGSTFKRPEGHFAGALIEQCGLKGCRIDGAQVSEKHAGFIVNVGDATAADILRLIEHVQRVVQAQTGVLLETEVRILGEN
ncbi:MAG: UDP-N-acetylmuramate dehydrogenase [Clostridia bacterium]|nr:UDP-N-acetylmuramate dehydrogenase [Clostridia bacterium]